MAMASMAVLAPLITHADPSAIAPGRRALPMSSQYWFGTDVLGRDLFARVVYGARVSLWVGFCVGLLSAVLGTALGMVSGMVRWVDPIVARLIDGVMSIPSVLLAIALMALLGGSVTNVIVAIAIAETPRVARLARGQTMALREMPYVEGAVLAGCSTGRVLVRHILPNIVGPLLVQTTFIIAAAIILESVLSFIGAGTPPAVPSWGNIMADGRAFWQIKPHIVFIPALFLSLTVLAVNLVGDALRDAFDPRSTHRA
jgi:peptide/nickel transport system permease protein